MTLLSARILYAETLHLVTIPSICKETSSAESSNAESALESAWIACSLLFTNDSVIGCGIN